MRAQQFAVRIENLQAVVIQNAVRQLAFRAWLEPFFVRVVHELAVGDVLAEVLVVVEEVAVQPLDKLTQGRTQGGFLGGTLAVGEAHVGRGVAYVQGPHVGHNVAPGGNLDLHAEIREDASHVGNGLLQGQVLALDIGVAVAARGSGEQGLGVFVQVFHHFNLEIRAGLHHFFHGATVDGADDALAVLVRNVFRQFHLNLENLLVAVFRVYNVVLRQADVICGNIPGVAVNLHKVGRAHGGRGQEIIKGAGCRAIAFVADGLV